jgi:hypothetical protein
MRGCKQACATGWFDNLYCYRAFQVEYGFAGYADTVTGLCAEQLTASLRDLKCMEIILAKYGCPIGNKHAMRRARDRIFPYAHSRRKKTGYEVTPISSGGNDSAATCDPLKCGEIGPDFSNGTLAAQYHHQILG